MQTPAPSADYQLIEFEIKSDPALFPPRNIEYLPDGLRITVALPTQAETPAKVTPGGLTDHGQNLSRPETKSK